MRLPPPHTPSNNTSLHPYLYPIIFLFQLNLTNMKQILQLVSVRNIKVLKAQTMCKTRLGSQGMFQNGLIFFFEKKT